MRRSIGLLTLVLALWLPAMLGATERESPVSADVRDAPSYLETESPSVMLDALGYLEPVSAAVGVPLAEHAAVSRTVDLHALNGWSPSAAAAPLQPRSTRPQDRMRTPPWPPRFLFHASHRFVSRE